MFFAIIFTLLLVGITIFLKKWGRTLYLSSKIPGPPAYPILGNGYLYYKKEPRGK